MSIPFQKIEDLISLCKQINEKEYEQEWDKRIHVLDIAETLQKLIDDEMKGLEEMAARFSEEEPEQPPTAEEMREIEEIESAYAWHRAFQDCE